MCFIYAKKTSYPHESDPVGSCLGSTDTEMVFPPWFLINIASLTSEIGAEIYSK